MIKIDQNGDTMWQKTWNHTANRHDAGILVRTLNGNDIFIAGVSQNLAGDYDIIIHRYGFDGYLSWSARYNGPGNSHDYPTGIEVDASGNVYIIGASTGSNTMLDWVTIKYNGMGIQQWATRYDNVGLIDIPLGLGIDNNSNVYVSGGTSTNTSNREWAVIKYNANGVQIINKTEGTGPASLDISTALKVKGSYIYTTGVTSANGTDYAINTVKYDTNLDTIWTSKYYGDSLYNEARALAVDDSGVYVLGYVTNEQNGREALTLKYTHAGVNAWTNRFIGRGESDTAEAVMFAIAHDGAVYVTGNIKNGSYQTFSLFKYDKRGDLQWHKEPFQSSEEQIIAHDLKLFSNGKIYLTATHRDTAALKYITYNFQDFERVNGISYLIDPLTSDTIGKYLSNQIIIKFDTAALKMEVINNKGIVYGSAGDFLKSPVISKIQQLLEVSIGSSKVYKIFRDFTTADSLSVARNGDTVRVLDLYTYLVLTLPSGVNEQFACDTLASLDSLFQNAHLNYLATPLVSANDDHYTQGDQTSLYNVLPDGYHIDIEKAWDVYPDAGRAGIKIGFIDSGLDYLHPDFSPDGTAENSRMVAGYDYFMYRDLKKLSFGDLMVSYREPGEDGTSIMGHGTRVTGIACATRNNSEGVAGIAGGNHAVSPVNNGLSIYAFACLSTNDESASVETIAQSIAKACRSELAGGFGVDILNMSFGFPELTVSQNNLVVNVLWEGNLNGTILVAARGNSRSTETFMPASAEDRVVISVGAANTNGILKNKDVYPFHPDVEDGWGGSSYSGGMDLIAPGDYRFIYTTSEPIFDPAGNLRYAGFTNTSAAAPHVSGVAGLMLSYVNDASSPQDNLSPEDVERLLELSAEDVTESPATSGDDIYSGYGALKAGALMEWLEKPVYKVEHFTTDESTNNIDDVTFTYTQVATNQLRFISTFWGSILGGQYYYVDVYKVEANVSHSIRQYGVIVNSTIDHVWERHSASNVYANSSVIQPMAHWVAFDNTSPPSSTSAKLYGYVFLVKSQSLSPITWLPFNPTTEINKARLAYSIHTMAEIPVAVEDQKPVNGIGVFPNPANENAYIT
ncbi:MAG: S8 family serine peptidase, partial [Bacteroidota bacterium]|nr:S8 family serine peptidase [Bacteroidota bacterium]